MTLNTREVGEEHRENTVHNTTVCILIIQQDQTDYLYGINKLLAQNQLQVHVTNTIKTRGRSLTLENCCFLRFIQCGIGESKLKKTSQEYLYFR